MTASPSDHTMTIDGRGAPTERTFDVIDPTTGEVFAQAPDCTRDQLDAALESAQRAFREWSKDEALRIQVLHDCAAAVEKNVEEIARLQSLEQGRPYKSSLEAVRVGADRFRYFADIEIPRLKIQDDDEALIEVARRPLGVIAAIKPFNGPARGLVSSVAPAIRTGNTVVFKPSPYTPLSPLAVGETIRDLIPAGVVNVVTGQDPLGQWMVEHPIPRGISFTGSASTGRKVNAAAAPDLKRVVLELGGNDPAIVLDDVDPKELARKLFWTAFRNTGQICMATKRVYVPEAIHDEVADALAEIARGVKVGDVFDEETELGPLTNKMQFERVKELVADAVEHGAKVLAGGHPIDRPGYFFEPTILTGISEGTRVVDEEQFGPVLPVMSYKTVDEAIERANATSYGLGASVWSANPDRAAEIVERLESGSAWVNTHCKGSENAPFGGVKGSGLGSQHGLWSIYSYTDPQTVWHSRRGATTYVAS